jgi:4-hydroxybenzoyl-CoA thioesterase
LIVHQKLLVDFGHCDPVGMVWPRRLFEYFDNGTWTLLETALGVRRGDFIATIGLVPLVDVRVNRHKTMRFGDNIEVASHIAEFRRSSFAVAHRVMLGDELAAEGTEMRVWATRDKNNSDKISARPIPPEVIARFG